MRRFVPAAMTALLAAATLTACAAPAAGCVPTPAGPASDSVEISGAFGESFAWAFGSPVEAETTERTVALTGDPAGLPVEDGTTAEVFYAIYNGATGATLEDSHELSDEPVPFPFAEGTSMPGLEKALHCSTEGSRIVAVIPPGDAFGGAGLPEQGLDPGQSLVFVADIVAVEPTGEATSAPPAEPNDLPIPQPWTEDVPTVDLAASPPTVTIPDTAPPADLVLTVLDEGDGEAVPNPATVTLDYLGTSWDTKEVFDSSYERGAPATFSTAGVIPGFAAAIVGQRVGSTVLVSIPPALAYGETGSSSHALAGQTLVFLIEIHSFE